MRRFNIALFVSILAGAAALLGSAAPASSAVERVREVAVANGSVEHADPLRDLEAIRRQIRTREAGTYIAEMLAARDSALARWADRGGEPVRVWVRPTSTIRHWTGDHAAQVHAAFREWNTVGLPVRFAFVSDSADAEVHVTWTERFDEPISGRTRWARDNGWWITDAVITLAVRHHRGMLLDGDAVRAMALHEIGHLLGLDHTVDPGSVMASRVRVRGVAAVDRATAQLLYSVPAGRLR